jgi:hypothetical protein
MKPNLLLLVFALLPLAAHAVDDETPGASDQPPTDFSALDADGDGRISLAEFTAPATQLRAAMKEKPKADTPADVSHDGILSAANSIEGRYSPEVFGQLDINHDKFLSPEELAALFQNAHNISQP